MPRAARLINAIAASCASLCLAALPARAEVEKFMNDCERGLCAFFRASITIPEGWVENKEATRYFNAVMLLPKGKDFEKAQAKIYAVARFNPEKKPVSDFIPDAVKQWRALAKDGKITKLDPLPRAEGKPAFERNQLEAKKLKEQGYEVQSVTSDSDKDGNQYVVTIVLSANSPAAFKAAEPAYRAILEKY